tara:strand:- start:1186 stop:1314 length:129 start_codon:yes stop_codon:yes gene_type:complete
MLKIFDYFTKQEKIETTKEPTKKETFKKPDSYKNINATTYNK